MEAEHEAARRGDGFIGRRRYRPQQWKAVRHCGSMEKVVDPGEALRMSALAQEQQPETAGQLEAQDRSPETTQQLLERYRHESVVIESVEFADSGARRRQKVAATG
jgi:hypothetical protein